MGRSRSLRTWVFGALVTSACSSSGTKSGTEGAGDQSTAGSGSAASGSTTGTGGSTSGPTGTAGASSATATSGGASSTSAGSAGASSATATTGGASSASGGSAGGAGDAGNAQGNGGGSSGSASDGGGPASGVTSPDGGAVATEDPGSVGDGEIMVGPTYTPSPDLTLKAGAPAGFTTSFTMTSAMSTIFNGSDFTPPLTFSRQIKVFVPQQYVDGTASPFMVSSDGFYMGLQTVVQNLAGNTDPTNSVPPLVIIGIQNGPDVHPNSERSLEYDTVSDRYWRFVTQEVIPLVLSNTALLAKFPNFKLTSDPNGRGGYGCSSGGPAVMGLAWFGDFNRVFSFSGSFVAIQKTTAYPEGAWEYTQLITAAPLRPDFRVFLEVGEHDNGYTTPATSDSNWVISNQNMAAALAAKGNHYRFIFANGAGHCDDAARNQVMPDGLIWLWRGYQAP
jgi:enterochelin esterase family protein